MRTPRHPSVEVCIVCIRWGCNSTQSSDISAKYLNWVYSKCSNSPLSHWLSEWKQTQARSEHYHIVVIMCCWYQGQSSAEDSSPQHGTMLTVKRMQDKAITCVSSFLWHANSSGSGCKAGGMTVQFLSSFHGRQTHMQSNLCSEASNRLIFGIAFLQVNSKEASALAL